MDAPAADTSREIYLATRIRHHSFPHQSTAFMISLYTFSKAAFAAIDRQVNELANMVVNFVELILMSLFW